MEQNIRLVSADIESSVLAPAMVADQGEHSLGDLLLSSFSEPWLRAVFISRWKVRVIYRQVKWKIHRWITAASDCKKVTFECCSLAAAPCTLPHSHTHVQVGPSSWVEGMLRQRDVQESPQVVWGGWWFWLSRSLCVTLQNPARKLWTLMFLLVDKPSSFPFQMFSTVACCLHLLEPTISQRII